jgi:hypothetical protein
MNPELPRHVQSEVQCILDRAARRILAEQLDGDRFVAGHGQDLELAAEGIDVARDGGGSAVRQLVKRRG